VDVPPGDTLLGFAHSHNFFKGDNVQPCDPRFTEPYDPDWYGGGSDADWPFLVANQYDVWVVTPERMYHLSPALRTKQEQLNNRERYDNVNYCAVR
jgi:hypothetical protein